MKLNPGLTNIFLSIRPPNIANFLYVQLEKIAAPPQAKSELACLGVNLFIYSIYLFPANKML